MKAKDIAKRDEKLQKKAEKGRATAVKAELERLQRRKEKWDEKVQKVRQGEKLYRDEVQRAVKDDLKKVGKWQKAVHDKELAEKRRAVEIQEAYTTKREDFANHRTMEEQEANERALDQLRLQKQKVYGGCQRYQK